MSNFDLTVITPEGVIYDEKIDMVIVPGKEGGLGILSHHIPLISALKKGEIRIKKEEKRKKIEIEKGFMKVDKDGVEILIQTTVNSQQ
ncbi:MAG: ATP synthase F1 subunit epsilon [Candidatus Omnitrophica bacterium 4484_213]|nr:MAG: ATP synthase F1 subunit epsilon [Candidatus Omnitrophica bacterium 4484_213]